VSESPRFESALSLPEGPRRTAAIAAWIQALYDSKPPVLVGGAAVELYTRGAYTTGDFDFVGGVPDTVRKALEEVGFRREGRHWIHSKGQLFVEFPGSAVQEHETTARIEVDGIRVLTLSPEDLIIDRLAAWQFWRSTTDGASAFLVLKSQEGRVDSKRLAKLAGIREVERGLKKLMDFASASKVRSPSAEEIEKWAGKLP
jgi:hypothetical protein